MFTSTMHLSIHQLEHDHRRWRPLCRRANLPLCPSHPMPCLAERWLLDGAHKAFIDSMGKTMLGGGIEEINGGGTQLPSLLRPMRAAPRHRLRVTPGKGWGRCGESTGWGHERRKDRTEAMKFHGRLEDGRERMRPGMGRQQICSLGMQLLNMFSEF
jgi:hypothetical protein